MRRKPLLVGLEQFGLTRAQLRLLGDRVVVLSIGLRGRTTSQLLRFTPRERCGRVRSSLVVQRQHLIRLFPDASFQVRGGGSPPYTLDCRIPARRVGALLLRREVDHLQIATIHGLRKKPDPGWERWFCVVGEVAIQVEGRRRGLIDIEDRYVLVRAHDSSEAERRLRREWREYAKPYMNSHGRLVRWQLIAIRDVVDSYDDTINANGTEVYSRFRSKRLHRSYEWHPRKGV